MIQFRLVTRRGDDRIFAGRAHLLAPEGWSVVSDIDDTIKDSNVLDKRELIRNTFLRDFKPVDGMADAYTAWARGGAAFHYVSASPWQLYPPLAEFLEQQRFPSGSFQLRHFRIQDGSAWAMLHASQEYKLAAITELLARFPRRKFILVGDTGEHDPEVYGETARRHPGRVQLIAVRNITNEALANARLTAAFQGVPSANVRLFNDAAALPSLRDLAK
jgi:phosphatidate phosphatase APP1